MNTYAIVSVDKPDELLKRLSDKFPDNYLELGNGAWFVAANITTQQVTETLNFAGDNEEPSIRAIVFAIGSYYGYHDQNTWEWLELKRGQ